MSIKLYTEKRNNAQKMADALLDKATIEERNLTNTEDEEYMKLEEEVAQCSKMIERLAKKQKQEIQESRAIEVTENLNKDSIEFENRAIEQLIKEKDGAEVRALTSETGKALVPTHLLKEIVAKWKEVAPIWNEVPLIPTNKGIIEIPVLTGKGNATWVGEMEDIKLTDFTMDKVKIEQRRCGTGKQLSQHLINDAGIDIVSYAKELCYEELAETLDETMITGTVAEGKFEGLVNIEKVHMLQSEKATMDELVNAFNNLKRKYQKDAKWVMSRKLFNEIALLKDGNGDYYMHKQLNVVDNSTEYKLEGIDVFVSEMEEIDNVGAYLVNFKKGYKGTIKKNAELKVIKDDTQNALKGAVTLILDIFTDARIVNQEAMIKIKRNVGGQV